MWVGKRRRDGETKRRSEERSRTTHFVSSSLRLCSPPAGPPTYHPSHESPPRNPASLHRRRAHRRRARGGRCAGQRADDDGRLHARHRPLRGGDQQARRRGRRHRPRRRAPAQGHRGAAGDPAPDARADRGGCALPLPARPRSGRGGRPQDPPQPRQHQRPCAGRAGHRRVQGAGPPHPRRRQRGLHRRAQGQAEAPGRTRPLLRRPQAGPPARADDRQARGIPRDLRGQRLPRHRHQRQDDGRGARDRHLPRDQPALRLPAAPGRHARRPARDRRDPLHRRAGGATRRRRRRHAAHQLRQRPGVRSRGRPRVALFTRPA